MGAPRTLFEKVWQAHVVREAPGEPALLYIDLHLVHEVTSPQAFAGLRARGLKVRRVHGHEAVHHWCKDWSGSEDGDTGPGKHSEPA